MRFLKKVQALSIIVLAIILLGTSLGLSSGVTKESLEYQTLSLRDVTEAFAQKGLKLVPVEEGLPGRITLGGVEPEVYRIGQTEDRVFVYAFDSQADRRVFNSFDLIFDLKFREFFSEYSQLYRTLTAKNILIVYCPHVYTLNPEDLHKDPAILRLKVIQDLVFTDLNKGQILVFRGEGQYWEAQAVCRHIEQFYKDAQGTLHFGGGSTVNFVARYKGRDASEVGEFNYWITMPHGSGSGTGFTLESDGFARLGGVGSNGLRDEKDIYTFTVEWQGKRETFELKLHPGLFALFPY